jgi:hypothetical protein
LPNHHNFKLYIYAVERKQIEQDWHCWFLFSKGKLDKKAI